MAILKERNSALIYTTPEITTLVVINIKLIERQKQEIIKLRHNNKLAGYLGIKKTIELVIRDFTQKGLRKNITKYIKNYDIYYKAKYVRYKLYRLLQTLKITSKVQSTITLDFIVKLPKSKEPLTGIEFNSILVINDTLTKYIYFVLYKEVSTVEELVYIFYKTIIVQYKIPKEIRLN